MSLWNASGKNASCKRGFRALGFTLVETSVVLGIVGILSAAGLSAVDFGNQDLDAVQVDLQGGLYQAFHLARARGTNVVVALGNENAPDVIPVKLVGKVKWGKPSHIPMPPGMEPTKTAESTGQAHPRITVTPRHTATATTWFVNNGKEAVCMRLSGHGRIHLLRWRQARKTWTRA
jgi:prepilin-type N-terminal cleavage/methylation domain-containing protein